MVTFEEYRDREEVGAGIDGNYFDTHQFAVSPPLQVLRKSNMMKGSNIHVTEDMPRRQQLLYRS